MSQINSAPNPSKLQLLGPLPKRADEPLQIGLGGRPTEMGWSPLCHRLPEWSLGGLDDSAFGPHMKAYGLYDISTPSKPIAVSGALIRALIPDSKLIFLSIKTAWEGQGLASSFLRALMEIERDLGASTLELDVRASNERAIALYEKLGFKLIGCRKDFYPPLVPGDPKENAHSMLADLSSPIRL